MSEGRACDGSTSAPPCRKAALKAEHIMAAGHVVSCQIVIDGVHGRRGKRAPRDCRAAGGAFRLTLNPELPDRLAEFENDGLQVVATSLRRSGNRNISAEIAADLAKRDRAGFEAFNLRGRILRNTRNGFIDTAYLVDDAADGALGAPDVLHAGFDLRLGIVDELLDFARRIARALGKSAHFLGNDSKAATAI